MKKSILPLFLLMLVLPPVYSQTGAEIMQKVLDNQSADTTAMDMQMTLIDSRGSTSTRRIQTLVLKESGVTRTITIFLEPASVRNTRFLSIENPGRSDDQWIYLPALRKVKRIAAGEKEGSFMGSDFSYADMAVQDAGDSLHTLLREESLLGRNCRVVESFPLAESGSVYGRLLSWVDGETYLTMRVEFYDRDKTTLVKHLTREGFTQIQDRWTADITAMETAATGHRTVLETRQVKFDIPLNPSYFTVVFLETGRAQ